MVSNSDIGMFQRCRRKWNLSSFNRRNLVPNKPNTKLWIGTGCHYALEMWHGHDEPPVEAFNRWVREQLAEIGASTEGQMVGTMWSDLDEVIALGRGVLKHYVEHAKANILPHYEFIATEFEFSVPIPDQLIYLTYADGCTYDWVIDEWGQKFWENEQFKKLYIERGLFDSEQGTIPPLYVGRLDGLVRNSSGHVFVIDHKFMAALVNPEMLLIDSQMSRYIWATNEYIRQGWMDEIKPGTNVRGALYNVVRKKVPRVPPTTQSGKTSKNKNIDTTYEVFLETVKERGERPSDFVDVLLAIRERGNRFFQLEPVERSDEALALVGERLTWEYAEMSGTAGYSKDVMHPGLYPSPKPDCLWSCSYKSICYTANDNGDVEDVIAQTMTSQERRDLYATQLEHLETG